MNTNTTALRVFTLADGRRVKEVPEVRACRGCMFDLGHHHGCARPEEQTELGCCDDRRTIYQPADPEPAEVAEPAQREPLTEEAIEASAREWMEKTDWLREPGVLPVSALGMHLADAMRAEFERMRAELSSHRASDPTDEEILSATREIKIPADDALQDEWEAYELAVARAALALRAKPVNRGHVGHLWRSDETGRLRLVELDCVITHRPGWSLVGPLFLGQPEPVKCEPLIARHLSEWHEDDGPACWWAWSGDKLGWADEPCWVGTPLESDWPGYHTHWTRVPTHAQRARAIERAQGIGERECRPEVLAALNELARDVASAAGSVGEQASKEGGAS